MTIEVGDKIPKAILKRKTDDGVEDVTTHELFAGKKVILFAVPGAFTPTCSSKHLPGYVALADDFRAKGADMIACVSVNDAFVMDAWGRDREVGDKIMMLADGSCDFTRALGLVLDGTALGNARSQRYAMIIVDGTVSHLAVEPNPGLDISAAEKVLAVM